MGRGLKSFARGEALRMKQEPAPGRHNPLLVGLAGLALMLAGWKVSTYVPTSGPDSGQETAPADAPLRDPTRTWHPPPYQTAGRLAFFAGLVLFVAAGVLMYRRTPAQDPDPDDTAEEAGADAGKSGTAPWE
jgi:hypothetical protein